GGPSNHGREVGRPVSTLATCGSVRSPRSDDSVAAGGHRRDYYLTDWSILPSRRSVPIDHSVCCLLAGLGLARAERPYHIGAWHFHISAMAGFRTLGDRPIPRNRVGRLRRHMDRVGAQTALGWLTHQYVSSVAENCRWLRRRPSSSDRAARAPQDRARSH